MGLHSAHTRYASGPPDGKEVREARLLPLDAAIRHYFCKAIISLLWPTETRSPNPATV